MLDLNYYLSLCKTRIQVHEWHRYLEYWLHILQGQEKTKEFNIITKDEAMILDKKSGIFIMPLTINNIKTACVDIFIMSWFMVYKSVTTKSYRDRKLNDYIKNT